MNDSRGDERKTHVGLYDGGGGGCEALPWMVIT